MKGHKEKLPYKICIACERPFSWRKKWINNWDSVLYCSRKCKS
ncbi:MAG: DUF2256 domain-containing protein [Bacteroidetes bacterium MED-G20]|nr:MAG: DUF2256 domain-containing protein [Bacteroidetes bacterium MED-G20]